MPSILSSLHYYVVKAAGENIGAVDFADVDLFVANNSSYWTEAEACNEAYRLSKGTPGNRYYVCMAVKGYMSEDPVKCVTIG